MSCGLYLVALILLISRIRNILSQLQQKDITSDEKQELHEALEREVVFHLVGFVTGFDLSFSPTMTLILITRTLSTQDVSSRYDW